MPTQTSSGLFNTIGAKLGAVGLESRRVDMNILQQGSISLRDVGIVLSVHIVHPIAGKNGREGMRQQRKDTRLNRGVVQDLSLQVRFDIDCALATDGAITGGDGDSYEGNGLRVSALV